MVSEKPLAFRLIRKMLLLKIKIKTKFSFRKRFQDIE